MQRSNIILSFALVAGVLAACSGTPDPTLTVRICGDLSVPDEVDAIRLTVLDPDRNQVWTSLDELVTPELDAARFDFALGEAGLLPPAPGDGGADGGDATLDQGVADAAPDGGVGDGGLDAGGGADLDAGVDAGPTGPAISLVEYVPAVRGEIWLQVQALKNGIGQVTAEVRPGTVARIALSRACVGVTCNAGLTCLDGQCVQVPPAMECPAPGGAAAEDASPRAPTEDTPATDAGPSEETP